MFLYADVYFHNRKKSNVFAVTNPYLKARSYWETQYKMSVIYYLSEKYQVFYVVASKCTLNHFIFEENYKKRTI
jgi:hypothetical protein